MTEREICYSYHMAKDKIQQIRIIAELNCVSDLEIIRILVRRGERLPEKVVKKLYRKLDKLEMQILELEREYKAVAAALKGEKKD